MMKDSNVPMTYEEFTNFISPVLLIEQAELTSEASFADDLFVDSLKLVEMALRIDQLGVEIPTEEYWKVETVGDAYDLYVSHTNAS